jgi:ferredoxin
VRNALAEHVAFLRQLESDGVMFMGGPFRGPDYEWNGSGMVAVRAASLAEATALAEWDPGRPTRAERAKVMDILIDRPRCEGHGQCKASAPHLFRLADDGIVELVRDDASVPPELLADAQAAVACCPVAALELGNSADARR